MDQAFFLALAKPLFLLSILLITLLKPKTYKIPAAFLAILISMSIWVFVGTFHTNFGNYLELIDYVLPGMLSLICLFVLRKHKWDSFNLGLLTLFLSSFFEFLSSQVTVQIIALALQTTGFILILRFFYVKTIMKIDRKAAEVQNKLNNI
jgi:uncharacterized membrane-anchored protein